jgi:signal transduction histidine kinase/CheY-like chemotaxis protein
LSSQAEASQRREPPTLVFSPWAVADALLDASTVEDVGRLLVEEIRALVGASAAIVCSCSGGSELVLEASHDLHFDGGLGLVESVRDARPIWSRDRTLATLPLITPRGLVGAVAFSFSEPLQDAAQERLFAVVSLYAKALERAKLLAAERASRAELEKLKRDVEAVARRASYTARIGACLAKGGELGAILSRVSSITASRFDLAAVRVWTVGDGGDSVELRASAIVEEDAHALEAERIKDAARSRSLVREGPTVLAPIVGDEICVAVLEMTSSGAMQQEVIEAVTSVTDMIAVSIIHARAEEIREQLVAELRETLHFNELFAGILAHDLRNPLSAILLTAQNTAMSTTDEQLLRSLVRIQSSANRMGRMIAQLLDVTRSRIGGGIALERAPSDVAEVAQQAVQEALAARPEWEVRLSVAGQTFGSFDSDRLAQILSNLLGNAISHGSEPRQVTVKVDGTGEEEIVVRVHNYGVIPLSVRSRLFDPFRGKDQRRTTAGLGLGLYISKQLAVAHKGQIEVESSETSGTTVTLRLPRSPAERTSDLAPRAAKSNGRVLIVEDDPDTRESLITFFRAEGFEPLAAENGARALEILRSAGRPDLILLDLMMPVMDGWQFRKAQLADTTLRPIPCVVVTAGFTAPFDVNDVLLKPLTVEKLKRAVRIAMTKTAIA